MMMGGMWIMMFFWLLLIVAGVVLVVWAVSRGRDGGHSASPHRGDTAQVRLRERFANGEISEAEYYERRKVLDDDRLNDIGRSARE